LIVADEFRDGNSLLSGLTRWVPAGSGNRRAVEKALAALLGGIDKIGDSALYEHDLIIRRWLGSTALSRGAGEGALGCNLIISLPHCGKGCRAQRDG